jgi:predicted enzyme related to lactoylglutathione lyase
MGLVTDIAFTGYPVTDIKRARAFYEGVLGLVVSRTFGEGEQMWIEYDLGPSTLAITSFSAEWKPSATGPSIALEVSDFEQMVRILRDNGVKFYVEPMDGPVCRIAVVADPDGNSLGIHHRFQK